MLANDVVTNSTNINNLTREFDLDQTGNIKLSVL